ncbi:hypothetical protein [Bartonella sp. AU18XJBT]|uniref:hypothetical protein n=1 Tax=Bartonella sp. AU18XJBT TaxID=3019089 RepID=UPI00235FDFEF|nr:hypothetical protein [Bartonella sp. AU18XJBT]
MWICKSEVEVQGRGGFMRCVGLGGCWAFGMAWNVVRWIGEVVFVNGGVRGMEGEENAYGQGEGVDKRRVCLRGGGAKG